MAEPPVKPTPDANGEWIYRCPYCEDRSGHMHVNPEKGVWHCYRCSRGGRTATLNKEFPDADYPDESQAAAEERGLGHAHDWRAFFQAKAISAMPPAVTKGAAKDARPLLRDLSLRAGADGQRGVPLPYASLRARELSGLGVGPVLYWDTDPARARVVLPPGAAQVPRVVRAAWFKAVETYMAEQSHGCLSPADLQDWHCFTPLDGPRAGRLVFPSWCPRTGALQGYAARRLALTQGNTARYLGPVSTHARPVSWLAGPRARLVLAGHVTPPCLVLVEGALDAVAVESACLVPAVALLGKGVALDLLEYLRALACPVVVLLDADATAKGEDARPCGRLRVAGIDARRATLAQEDPACTAPGAIVAALREAGVSL